VCSSDLEIIRISQMENVVENAVACPVLPGRSGLRCFA